MSVKTASSVSTDGSSSTRLCVGYFWVLDRLESELKLPRRRRLVCHSSLPQSASVYAENEKYEAIMSDLTRQGVFASEYSGSTDLADIHIKKLPSSKVQDYHDSVTGFSQEYINYVREVEKVRNGFLFAMTAMMQIVWSDSQTFSFRSPLLTLNLQVCSSTGTHMPLSLYSRQRSSCRTSNRKHILHMRTYQHAK